MTRNIHIRLTRDVPVIGLSGLKDNVLLTRITNWTRIEVVLPVGLDGLTKGTNSGVFNEIGYISPTTAVFIIH